MTAKPAPASKNTRLKIAAAVSASLTLLIAVILYLLGKRIITFEMAMLMFVALLGLYFGFGVLIAVYRFISRLE